MSVDGNQFTGRNSRCVWNPFTSAVAERRYESSHNEWTNEWTKKTCVMERKESEFFTTKSIMYEVERYCKEQLLSRKNECSTKCGRVAYSSKDTSTYHLTGHSSIDMKHSLCWPQRPFDIPIHANELKLWGVRQISWDWLLKFRGDCIRWLSIRLYRGVELLSPFPFLHLFMLEEFG